MFAVNKEDFTISVTRGDAGAFSVGANIGDASYEFKPDDVVRLKVSTKKDCADVVLQKDFKVTEACSEVEIALDKEDTTIGEVISKPVDYWYKITLNPETYPQTFIGHDDEGAKLFRLFP